MIITQNEFDYLNQLRNTGAVNMFGAAPHLVRDLGLDKKRARDVTIHFTMGDF